MDQRLVVLLIRRASLARCSNWRAFNSLTKEVKDIAGQHDEISENLGRLVSDETNKVHEVKTKRKKVRCAGGRGREERGGGIIGAAAGYGTEGAQQQHFVILDSENTCTQNDVFGLLGHHDIL